LWAQKAGTEFQDAISAPEIPEAFRKLQEKPLAGILEVIAGDDHDMGVRF
jgi:hypothetical protein